MQFVDHLVVPLQRLAVTVSTALARGLGVPASSEGSQVILSRGSLVVGAPCSGLYSLIALLALAVLLAYLVEGRWWARAALAVLAIPAALVANAGRVLALLLIAERWGSDVALGLWHTWAGPVFFGAATALLFLASRWLGCSSFRADI
jgi:exosortase